MKGSRGAWGSWLWPDSCQHSTGPGKLGEVMNYMSVADLKGKKIKKLLNAGFPSEAKPERERARDNHFPHINVAMLGKVFHRKNYLVLR